MHLEPAVESVFPLVDFVVGEGGHVHLGEQEPALTHRERVRRVQAGPLDRLGDFGLS